MTERNFHFREELLNKQISYCLREECTKKGKCLHYLAYQHSQPFMTAIFRDPRNPQKDEACPDYLSNEVQRVGRGFRRALAQIPYGKIQQVRSRMQGLLNCCYSRYYKYASGEVPLKLEQAKAVQKFFVAYGLEPDKVFDTYEETYILD